MIRSDTLEEKAAFDRFSDLMAKLMIKYGPDLLKRKKEELEKILLSSIDISPVLSTEALYRRLKAYHGCVYQNNTDVTERALKTTEQQITHCVF